MPENESVNVETRNQDVTDAELDAAFQEFMGDNYEEKVVEKVETTEEVVEEPNVQPLTHPDNSRLGRKVKFMEEQMKSSFTSLNSKIDTVLAQLNKPAEPVKQLDEFGEEVEPKVDIDKLVDEKIIQHETAKEKLLRDNSRKYQEEYTVRLRELINEIEDPVIARQVFKKMVEPGGECNAKLSDNPSADCAKNFIRAVKTVNTPFSGKRGASVPNGVSVTTTNVETEKHLPKLDPEAEEFAKAMGMGEEDIKKALEGEVPLSLRGKTHGI